MNRVVVLLSLCLACQGASPKTRPPEAAKPEVSPIPEGYRAVLPILIVPDVEAALSWYDLVFDVEPTLSWASYEGEVMYAEFEIGDARLGLDVENPEKDWLTPGSLGGTNVGFYVYVEDVDAAFERAINAGAEARMLPADMMWGDRVAEFTDPVGHRWTLATHVQDISPEQMLEGAAALGEALAAGEEPPAVTLEPTATSWKPEGYTEVTPGLVVEGGIAALSFYENAFAAKVIEELPMPDGQTLLHATVRIGDSMLMLSSPMPADPELRSATALGGTAVYFYHYVERVESTWQTAIEAGATLVREPTEEFWGDLVGSVLDPSGTWWDIASRVRELSPEEMAKAFAEQHAQEQLPD